MYVVFALAIHLYSLSFALHFIRSCNLRDRVRVAAATKSEIRKAKHFGGKPE